MQTTRKRRLLITVLCVLTVSLITAATVYAYLSMGTSKVENTVSADKDPKISITETFNGTVKSNVAVKVEDTAYSVYVRAAIVVTWKNNAGEVYATAPVPGVDYQITLNNTDWFSYGGFYYCKSPVGNNASTAYLIHSCQPVDGKAPVDYTLSVEIVAQAIQAQGTTDADDTPAVQDAGGVAVDTDGTLKKP